MKKLATIILAAAIAIPAIATSALAYPSYLNSVNAKCGTSNGCGLCHIDPKGGGPLTAAGTGFLNSGYDPCYFCPTVCNPPGPTCTDADGDGFYAQSGCGTAVDCNDNDPTVYPGAPEICNDGKDNNCDGKVDCADAGCANNPGCVATPTCTDADGDGYYAEPNCGTSVDCNDHDPNINPGMPEICGDGIDNNCDGKIDCADSTCKGDVTCTPSVTPEVCNDGIDNDGDGLIDCADPDCKKDPDCTVTSTKTGKEHGRKACSDGIDNDGDGLIDCEDPDCQGKKPCREKTAKECSDGIDNDHDGLIDCADPDCARSKACRSTSDSQNSGDSGDSGEHNGGSDD